MVCYFHRRDTCFEMSDIYGALSYNYNPFKEGNI